MPTRNSMLSRPPNVSTSSTACSSASIAQPATVLPRTEVVSPTIAHELIPVNAARYGVRPLTRMPIRKTSGISVGQRALNDSRSFGISSSVKPRRPRRLASKCTCMKTP